MKKIKEIGEEEEETIINSEYIDPCFTEETYDSDTKNFSFLTEYMSLSLKDKTTRYSMDKSIRSIKNPITSDTIFHYLSMNDDNYPLLKIINPSPAEKEQKNNLGQTILHIAVQNKCYKIVKYLLETGSNIQVKDKKNNTPLHVGVLGGDLNIVKLLLNNNPKLDVLNNNNETPFDIAKKMKNQKIINFLKNFTQENEKIRNSIKNNNIVLKLKEINKADLFYNLGENNNNSINNINKSILNNISVNNWSLDTKNETESQSFNIYMKKRASNISNNFQYLGENKDNEIKNNKTININVNNCINNNNTLLKNKSYKCLNKMPSKFLGNNTSSIYRKTSPKKINTQYTLIEFDNDYELKEYIPRKKCLSPNMNKTKYQSDSMNNININRIIDSQKIITYEKYKNIMNHKNNNLLFNNNSNDYNNYNHHIPLSLNINDDNQSNYSKKSNKIKKVRQTFIHRSPFNSFESKSHKDEICKEQLLHFLKEIKMEKYGNILISEGLDDINLILKQMKEGFPKIDDTLKEIEIISAGDRAKLLIRLQEVSNGFNFDFPFEEVYFKNNGSIMKWLKREGLSQYNKNFINVGYQSFELLLIQMASNYKINEDILKNELFIINNIDRKKIMKSLEINSEKYVQKLNKKGNIQRSFSKMVENDSNNLCIII